MSADDKNFQVELRPFKHQVGGHTCVLEISSTAICKPFNPIEAWFYDNVSDGLKIFVPKYLGETYVTCDLQNDRKCLIASVPKSIVDTETLSSRQNGGSTSTTQCTYQPRKKRRRSSKQNDTVDGSNDLMAWSATCIDRQIRQYGFWTNNQPQRFIILENLVHKYKSPCMMDLKMGRRQYGEDACDEKRKLLESRCAHTTSFTLGFRICGSQVFDVSTGKYICRDKYFGRKLDNDGVVKELTGFFHDGQNVRVDVIRGILNKLKALTIAMDSQKRFRFHSASLLLMYDAAEPLNSEAEKYLCHSEKVDEHVGDAVSNEGCESESVEHHACSRHESLKSLSDVPESGKDCVSSELHMSKCDRKATYLDDLQAMNGDAITDVRLIDFAHVSEISDDASNNGSEETISFGLEKLQGILTNIIMPYSRGLNS